MYEDDSIYWTDGCGVNVRHGGRNWRLCRGATHGYGSPSSLGFPVNNNPPLGAVCRVEKELVLCIRPLS